MSSQIQVSPLLEKALGNFAHELPCFTISQHGFDFFEDQDDDICLQKLRAF
jgi:hypothetical protein